MAHAKGSRIVTGLPQLPSGVPPELFNQFFSIYQAISNLADNISQLSGIDEQDSDTWSQLTVDQTVWQINPGRLYVPQFESLTYGNCVSPILSSGLLQVRKANATNNTKPAIGFVSSQDHVPGIGNYCEVTIGVGLVTGVGSLSVPNRYFLSTTDGIITNVAPAAAGNIRQVVGWALAANRLLMNINVDWTQL